MTSYTVNPNVRWVVERFTVTLTNISNGCALTLQYPEAAVWDLLSRGYPFAKVVSMTCYIASIEATAADALVRASVEGWVAGGFLESAPGRFLELA